MSLGRPWRLLLRLHNDERGMEALQMVIIMAFGSIVLAFGYSMFKPAEDGTIGSWVKMRVSDLFGFGGGDSGGRLPDPIWP
jgi:hypothetical protein